jgi:hypothetical protein
MFFNSVTGDRKYKAEDWAQYFKGFIGNGIFLDDAAALKVNPLTGRTLRINAGMAFINGYAYYNDADLDIDIPTVTADRIDRVAVRLDFTERKISTVVKQGTVGASPVAPELIRNADMYEMGIADINLTAGIVEITADRITDLRRDSDLSGEVYLKIYNSLMTADITNAIAAFAAAGSRQNIDAADKIGVILGKIKKWLADLGTAAFCNTGTTSGTIPVIGADGKLPASVIPNGVNISTPNNFGNATTLQGALNFINNVFGGTQKVAKLVADTFDTVI